MMTANNTTTTPRIYVACLASYNCGTLHGEWIDATDAGTIQEAVAAMLRRSKFPNVEVECPECEGCDDDCTECSGKGKVPSAEEWAIHDYEGFHGFSIGESESFDRVAEVAELLEEHGPAYAAYASCVGEEYATPEGFQDAYCGEADSEKDYAENYVDEHHDLDAMMGELRYYFDYDAYARDMFQDSHVSQDNPAGGIFVFYR